MTELKSIQERLIYVFDLTEESNYIISQVTGISEATIGRIRNTNSYKPQNATLIHASKYLGVDFDWLKFGKGSPPTEVNIDYSKVRKNQVTPVGAISPDDVRETLITKSGNIHNINTDGSITMEVTLVSKPAYAGYPQIFDNPELVGELPKIPIPVEKIHRGEYRCFEVRGDSMTNNENVYQVVDGEIVVCRRLSRHLWDSPLRIRTTPVWVIVLKDDILIKQISNHDLSKHEITIHSFNDNKKLYPDEVISMNDVYELYYVIKRITNF